MKTLSGMWVSFEATVLSQLNLSESERILCKMIFFSGAKAYDTCLNNVDQATLKRQLESYKVEMKEVSIETGNV